MGWRTKWSYHDLQTISSANHSSHMIGDAIPGTRHLYVPKPILQFVSSTPIISVSCNVFLLSSTYFLICTLILCLRFTFRNPLTEINSTSTLNSNVMDSWDSVAGGGLPDRSIRSHTKEKKEEVLFQVTKKNIYKLTLRKIQIKTHQTGFLISEVLHHNWSDYFGSLGHMCQSIERESLCKAALQNQSG